MRAFVYKLLQSIFVAVGSLDRVARPLVVSFAEVFDLIRQPGDVAFEDDPAYRPKQSSDLHMQQQQIALLASSSDALTSLKAWAFGSHATRITNAFGHDIPLARLEQMKTFLHQHRNAPALPEQGANGTSGALVPAAGGGGPSSSLGPPHGHLAPPFAVHRPTHTYANDGSLLLMANSTSLGPVGGTSGGAPGSDGSTAPGGSGAAANRTGASGRGPFHSTADVKPPRLGKDNTAGLSTGGAAGTAAAGRTTPRRAAAGVDPADSANLRVYDVYLRDRLLFGVITAENSGILLQRFKDFVTSLQRKAQETGTQSGRGMMAAFAFGVENLFSKLSGIMSTAVFVHTRVHPEERPLLLLGSPNPAPPPVNSLYVLEDQAELCLRMGSLYADSPLMQARYLLLLVEIHIR